MLQLFSLSTISSGIRSKGFAEFDMDKRKLGQLNITNDNDKRPGLEESDWDQDLRGSASFTKLYDMIQFAEKQPSPACKPNLDLALPNWKWDSATKFKRIYFYHARKG